MSGAPEPTFEGDLERTPFLHLLAQIHLRALGGTLAIWPEDESVRGQDRIRFEAGAPVAARLLAPGPPLLDRALLAMFPRTRGAFAFYEGVDLAPDAAIVGKVDPLALLAASLRVAAREDAVAAVLEQFAGTTLRFTAGAEAKRYALLPKEERLVDVMRAGPATPEELASSSELGLELGQRLVYLFLVTRALEPYQAATRTGAARTGRSSLPGGTPSSGVQRPQSQAGVPPKSSAGGELPSPEAIARALAPPGVPADMAQGAGPAPTPAPPRAAASSPRSSLAAPRRMSDAPPPASLSADALAQFLEIKERINSIDGQNYYDMLGVPRDAPTDGIRKQYFTLAKRWHPDRVPAELAFVKADVDTIFQLLTLAHDTLTDEVKRGQYLRQVQDGGGTPAADRKLAAIVTAAMEQQKAEVLMKRRDFAGAKALLERAMELNPDEPDLHASYAGCLLGLPDSDALLPEVLRRTERALATTPTHDRAHYNRGLALRRIGREREALESFQRAAASNPKNIDAVREMRLAQMRGVAPQSDKDKEREKERAEEKGKSGGGGFLDKLFGSSKKKG